MNNTAGGDMGSLLEHDQLSKEMKDGKLQQEKFLSQKKSLIDSHRVILLYLISP